MTSANFDTNASVYAVMRRWPWTVRTFIRWKMQCVGCPFAEFHSVAYASDEHGIDEAAFFEALNAAVAGGPEAEPLEPPQMATLKPRLRSKLPPR